MPKTKTKSSQIIHHTNIPGPGNDMLDIFEELLEKRRVRDPDGRIAKVIDTWRAKRDKQVHFTAHEIAQMEELFDLMGSSDLKEGEKARRIARAIDYKMKYELREARDRKKKWTKHPHEIIEIVKGLDISEHGRVVETHRGDSEYVVINLERIHFRHTLEGDIIEPETIKCQAELTAIQDVLIKNGINVLAIEAGTTKEYARELAEPRHKGNIQQYETFLYAMKKYKKSPFSIFGLFGGDLLQKENYGGKLHTFGAESRKILDKTADLSQLCLLLQARLKKWTGKNLSKDEVFADISTFLQKSSLDTDEQDWQIKMFESFWPDEKITKEQFERSFYFIEILYEEYNFTIRNHHIARNVGVIQNNTLTNAVMLFLGAAHFLESAGKKRISLPKIFKDKDISFVQIRPHTVHKYLERKKKAAIAK
jgi:hypothetical protein